MLKFIKNTKNYTKNYNFLLIMNNLTNLRRFLEIPYDKLEEMNLQAKKLRLSKTSDQEIKNHYLNYLTKEKLIKAVTIGFSDLEGRFHTIDYDKKFFLKNNDNLTFDGSSIRGFSRQAESDLRLKPNWRYFWWLPSDVFGPGKVLIMGEIYDQNNNPYQMDCRNLLKTYTKKIEEEFNYTFYVSNEIEGFLVKGVDAEKNYDEKVGFELAAKGGYYHSLPNDTLRNFIDRTAEAQRALGFENEKDHPEVAPSQFELNYSYSHILTAADQVLIYKLVARQIAQNMGMTAVFLPKPIVGINGSGMHTNISIFKNGKNVFYDKKGESQLSKTAWEIINKFLTYANDFCLIANSSVNAYRRLDPKFEAPNEIRVSKTDRTAMIRIPIFDEKSARIEIRSIAPDTNPYLLFYVLVKIAMEAFIPKKKQNKSRERVSFLPGNIYTAIKKFQQSQLMKKILPKELRERFIDLKQKAANRCPLELGKKIKNGEVLYHHEIYNQAIWNNF